MPAAGGSEEPHSWVTAGGDTRSGERCRPERRGEESVCSHSRHPRVGEGWVRGGRPPHACRRTRGEAGTRWARRRGERAGPSDHRAASGPRLLLGGAANTDATRRKAACKRRKVPLGPHQGTSPLPSGCPVTTPGRPTRCEQAARSAHSTGHSSSNPPEQMLSGSPNPGSFQAPEHQTQS